MGSVTVHLDYEGFGALLRGPEVRAVMEAHAEKVRVICEATAPVDTGSGHPGRYKGAFHVSSGVQEGATARAYGRVSNDAPEAVQVEYGRNAYTTQRTSSDGKSYTVRVGAMAAHHTMLRALGSSAIL